MIRRDLPRELSFTDNALADLDAATGWLTQPGSGPAARHRLAAIWPAIEGLRDHPCLYPIGQHRGVHELPCAGGYRALYRVIPDTGRDETAGNVRVLRVFGPASPATEYDATSQRLAGSLRRGLRQPDLDFRPGPLRCGSPCCWRAGCGKASKNQTPMQKG